MRTIRIFSEEIFPGISICGSSMQGDREYQQDAMFYKKGQGVIAAVCDGMGGLKGGEIASTNAIEILSQSFEYMDNAENIADIFLKTAIEMDRTVARLEDENGERLHAGTTAVATYIKNEKLYWMSVGDSKIYIIRNGQIQCVTIPHTYGEWIRRNGKFAYAASGQPKNEALMSFIGMDGIRWVDYNESPFILQEGDVVLLCSDGLYKSLMEHEILQIIEACSHEFQQTAGALIDSALEYGKRPLDNCTVIVMKYD